MIKKSNESHLYPAEKINKVFTREKGEGKGGCHIVVGISCTSASTMDNEVFDPNDLDLVRGY